MQSSSPLGSKDSSFLGRLASSNLFFWSILLAWTVLNLAGAARRPFGGHADDSNTLTVAQNVAGGNGFTVNFVWSFFHERPIPHPEDSWPLLYPALVAVSMGTFGNNPVGWRVPNILLLVLTAWLLRRISLDIYKQRSLANLTGLLYLALGPSETTAIRNHTLLVFLFVLACYSAAQLTFRVTAARMLLLGFAYGALLLAKPDSLFVLAGVSFGTFLLIVLQQGRFDRTAVLRSVYPVGLPLLIALAVWSPWLWRNYQTFGKPLFSEHQNVRVPHRHNNEVIPWEAAYVVRYDNPPQLREVIDKYGGVLPWLRKEGRLVFEGARQILFSQLGLLAIAGLMLAASLRHWDKLEARLLALNLAAFLAHGSFVLLYWHYEERYFFPYLPILLVFILGRVFERVRDVPASLRRAYHVAVAAILLVLALPQVLYLQDLFQNAQPIPADVVWVRENTPTDSRVMTRDPWEFYFHTGREAVMIPFGSIRDVQQIMKSYGVDYLVLRKPSLRPALLDLLLNKRTDGIEKVSETDGFVIFRCDAARFGERTAGSPGSPPP